MRKSKSRALSSSCALVVGSIEILSAFEPQVHLLLGGWVGWRQWAGLGGDNGLIIIPYFSARADFHHKYLFCFFALRATRDEEGVDPKVALDPVGAAAAGGGSGGVAAVAAAVAAVVAAAAAVAAAWLRRWGNNVFMHM